MRLSRLRTRAKRWLDDLATGICVLVALSLALTMTSGGDSMVKPLGGLTIVVAILAALSLTLRRELPLAIIWITLGTAALLPLVEWFAPGTLLRGGSGVTTMPVMPPTAPFAAYAAMAFARDRRMAWLAVALLLVVTGWTADVLPDQPPVAHREDSPDAVGFRSLVCVAGGALLGLYVGARRRIVEGLTERAQRAEREQHLLAEQARAEERSRLAAEMHDVVAHRVTLMVLQAGALRVRAGDEETRSAAEELRETGCQALEELRDVIGLLRRDDAQATEPHEPLPDLSALVAESVSVGVPVELREEGERPLASPVVGRTAYRIVQESLTNVHKHAPGAQVKVYVRYGARGVRLSVRNTAPDRAADSELAAAGSGTGLLGLRQRVELIGGRLRAAPDRDGGFRVEAYLPAFVATPEPAA